MIIDAHGHVMAPTELYAYQAMLLASRGHHGKQGPNITDERLDQELEPHVELLKSVGTDMQFLSPRPFTMMHSQEPHLIVQWYIEAANDVIARQVERHPEMFRGLCGLPQSPDLPAETCVDELERCVNDLGFIGCILNPDPSEGHGYVPPLGDPYWYPLYEKLVDLDVPALIHSAGCHNRRETYSNHFITEETIAVLSLVEARVLDRYPSLKLIVAHGGGSVPYQIGRWRAHQWRTHGDSFDDALRKLYFDTVLYNAESLELLFRIIGTDRVLFGTEKPGSGSAQDPVTGRWFDDLKPLIDNMAMLSDEDRFQIYEGNTRGVYSRFKDAVMGKRQVLDIPGVRHKAPIPLGCRVGNLVYSSALMGMDPATSQIPDDGPEQVRLAFANVRALLADAGATTDDVVFLNVFVADDAMRTAVNEAWLDMFPDENDRPARHTTKQDLPGNMLVQVEFVAVL